MSDNAGLSVQDLQKQAAAEAALLEVQDGMVLGLGTGSTATFFVAGLGRRVRDESLRVVGIPTSERTAAQARGLGIPLATLGEHPVIDLTVDGADEVADGTLDLVKGLGGALLREKIVAAASRRMLVVVDAGKRVRLLGSKVRVPVEVAAFGWQATLLALRGQGMDPHLRLGDDGQPFHTDGGNLILDCATPPIADPAGLQAKLKALVGVMETGLFVGMADRVIVGSPDGPLILERQA
jgi:ribose 5-phosphate isomerase A